MSTNMRNPSTSTANDFCVAIFILLVIIGALVCFILHCINTISNERLQAFNTHFAPLPEVQEMYNLTTLYANWPTFPKEEDVSWSRIGSESPPQSLLELTTNLLLKSVEKQHALESEVKTLAKEVETLRRYFLYALGFAAMFVFRTLWRLESIKSK